MAVTTVNLGKIRVNWRGPFASTTAYTINDAVSYSGSSYICVTAYTSTSSFPTDLGLGYWQLMAQGATTNTTTGDITYRAGSGSDARLPVGTSGQVLTVSTGGVPVWETNDSAGAVYYVTTNGLDTNNGLTLGRAFKTIRYACTQITGPATLYIKAGTYNEQLPITVPANVTIVGDGMRDTVVNPLVGATNTTYVSMTTTALVVASTSGIGIGMTVTGTGFTGGQTVVAVVNGTTLTMSATFNTTPSGVLTFTYLSTDASPVPNQISTMFLMSDQTMLTGLLMTGMTGFTPSGAAPADYTQATVGGVFLRLNPASPIANKSPYIKDCTAKSTGGVGAIVDGSVHASGNRSMVFWAFNQVHDGGVGLVVANLGKAEAVSCFTYYCYFGYFTYGGGVIRSLSGNNSYGTYGCVSQGFDSTESPVTGTVHGNMLTLTTNTLTGVFQQGEIITQPYAAGISISSVTGATNTATINYASQGASPFAVGQAIIIAGVTPSGYNGNYVVATSTATVTTFSLSGAGALGNGTGGTIKGVANAYVTSVQAGYLYYKQIFGTFNTSTTVSGSTSGSTVSVTTDSGQNNYLLVLRGLSATPQVGASIQFTTGDTSAYVIQAVSSATVNAVALTIITLAQQKVTLSADGIIANIRYNFSNIRLTGHDFLSIGTGGIATTNYPGIPSQSADPAKQTLWTFPGRIYYVTTDQSGNFSVGQYFSVNQATGAATLNASAFNLSGLTSLRLGTIGAQLGAQVDEFSTDGTLSQNSTVKVPTQSAVKTYLGATYQNISPAVDTVVTTASASTGNNITVATTVGMVVNMTVVFGANMGNIVKDTVYYVLTASGTTMTITATNGGTTPFTVGTTVSQNIAVNTGYSLGDATKRWSHLYVGPGSITIGSLTLTDQSGVLQVTAAGVNAPANINSIQNGTSNVTVANNGSVTITGGGNLGLTVDSSGNATFAGTVTVSGGTTTINSTNLNISDSLIYMATGNSANINDIGLVGHFTSGIYQHTGLIRRAADNTWYLFSGMTTEPTTTITISDGTFALDPLKMGALTASTGGFSGNVTLTGATPTLALNNTAPTISTNSASSTASVLDTNATTVNAFGASTATTVGAATGTHTVRNATVTLSNATALNINGASPGIVTSDTGTAAVFNTNALTGNLFGAATTVTIGAATGTLNLRNATITAANATALNLNGANPSIVTTSSGTASVFNTNALTGNLFGVATTISVATSAVGASSLTFGSNVQNNTITINGNSTSGTATITTNVTTGTINLFNSITTATVNIGSSTSNVLVNGIKPASTGKAIAMAMVFGG
jgi:hypothetical protein